MKTIIKTKWLWLLLWLVAAVGLALVAPNMEALVRDKGQIRVPDGYSSSKAAELVSEMTQDQPKDANEEAVVLVFHNDNGLSSSDLEEAKHGYQELHDNQDKYGITSVISHFETKDLEKQMVAKDGKTLLMLVNISMADRTPAEASDTLYKAISDVKLTHYYTGNMMINEDVVQSSQEGLKKTEWITVVFILSILFVVFRSLVAPFIPLLTVGISYVVAQSIVAFLVDKFGFPLSNFTQIFMVAIMFGIGTDYCILLISRFKEELAHGHDRITAILNTYRTAGKTVFFSGLAVLVGFASIGFSTFSLYRSAVAVAVGVAVLLLALITLVPFFMAALGNVIFWPSKGSLEHKENRLWGIVGNFSLTRPLWALVILAVIIVPFLSAYQGATSFNSMDEIGDRYNSVKAFNQIAESFGPGESMPSKVVVKVDKPLDSSAGLATVEQVTRELLKVEGVKSVRSATRPAGDTIEDLTVSKQVNTLGDGLGQGEDALGQIGKGLNDASKGLTESAPKLNQAVDGAGKLIDGTIALKSGVVQLGAGLKQIEKGLRDGSVGAADLSKGLKQAKDSADQLAAASQELLRHYQEMGKGLGDLTQAYQDVSAKTSGLAEGLSTVGKGLTGLAQKYPELQNDPDFKSTVGAVTALQTGATQLGDGLKQLNAQLDQVAKGLGQANGGLAQAQAGQVQLAAGLSALAQGLDQLQAGITQAANGQGQIVSKLPAVTSGFDNVSSGQKELQNGFAQLNGQLGQLTDGLNKSTDGLSKVSGGLQSANDYLNKLSTAPDKQMTGWYIPDEALQSADFQKALDVYMSKDRKITTFDVVFAGNPYDVETLKKVDGLNEAVARGIKGTDYATATYAVSGVTSINNDLKNISAEDYARTVMLMLIGIAVILVLMFRSIVLPIYIILSLLLTYYTSMAISEVIFVRLLGQTGISWAVPFFGFVLLMALGVDYSIFLMDRFKEYRHMTPHDAILLAMKKMGSVIISAAVILGGTFAAMLPSGVMSLLQIATILLCGLFLYAFVMLPLFIPVMVRTFGAANWWPFMGRAERPTQEQRQPVKSL
ncbi:MMPL family transporter [Tumebacillus permanentifrigoris]|uniref:RND superfamily putative drug exporter n=1 Tax=Tumebacillus permanentifrigoris TaxID=378543 RepID=A0A316DEU3_9BACL|nr:MMPL family transporter [Tumebacillus permanentifrigoris]PWK16485.1 RND superfamily putative drug exporter [Tumebacillus permanentifrigoris]